MMTDVEFKSNKMREFSGLICRTVDITGTNFLGEAMLYHAILFNKVFVDEQGHSA